MQISKQKQSKPKSEVRLLAWLLLSIYSILNYNCNSDTHTVASSFVDIKPVYSEIKLTPKDTLHFSLGKNTYNKIRSFNYFTTSNGAEYISFYDRLSESVTIYDFVSGMAVKKIKLKEVIKARKFYKASAYVHDFDSIYITNADKLYLIDSAGKIIQTATFNSLESIAFFENQVPVIVKGKITLMGARPFVSEKSLSAIKNWKVLCAFDLQNETYKTYYSLPDIYRKGLFGRRFLEYSYCYNDKGNFVFSFPADTNIYETNLTDLHVSYTGKSKFQTGSIEHVTKESLDRDEGGKEYTIRNSYGPIYYDPYKKRYIRIAKQKIGKEAMASKTGRKTTIIVFDQEFKIIGEFEYQGDYILNTIFFTPNGSVYARINKEDEYALHFVRLIWENESNEKSLLTKK